MDLLTSPLLASLPIIVLQTVLDEVRHRSLPLFNRLKQLIGDEDRLVWVFWNEARRLVALAVSSPLRLRSVALLLLTTLRFLLQGLCYHSDRRRDTQRQERSRYVI